ncbi:chalcone isomerase family protein [Hirschia maritima]|uniref:chalcone isomerase family protein n=1 Tax=Hirschia maritima TaxID=1121961 RepID=UPI00036ED4D8|nr:chalcone isomerase family protein [Hirschia maritima]
MFSSQIIFAISFLLLSPEAAAASEMTLQPVGKVKYSLGPFKLYTATLLAPNGVFSSDDTFDLELTYARNISAKKLANASIIEMARLNQKPESTFEPLRQPLVICFGDVNKGDQITGRKQDKNRAEFYRNGALNCEIDHPNFSENFFSIWLSPEGRYPKKTARLLGLN